MNLLDHFKAVQKGARPPEEFLLQLYKWFSSKEGNIEAMQKINKRFMYGNRNIYITELALNISVKGFMRFPKKPNEGLPMFFLEDAAKLYGWTIRELKQNFSVIDLEQLKIEVSKQFGYSKSEIKQLH